jgi:nitrite reductase/ring-hydroxylating ferredoxin subunit
MTKRVRACRAADVDAERVVPVRLAPSELGLRREALVLRDERGELRVYRNLCKHLPISLDAGMGTFTTKSGEHVLCVTHGARYRREDGLCVHGPCRGTSLDAVPFEIDDGDVVLLDNGR